MIWTVLNIYFLGLCFSIGFFYIRRLMDRDLNIWVAILFAVLCAAAWPFALINELFRKKSLLDDWHD